jgi:hypothetical protein
MLLRSGQVDAALCGAGGDWWRNMTYLLPIVPLAPGVGRAYALSCLILQNGPLFFCDTHVNVEPTAEQVAEMTILAADAVRGFGLQPKAALLSHSSFGASSSPTARKMRQALALLREQAPELEVDGEMHADAALSQPPGHRQPADRLGQPADRPHPRRRQHSRDPAGRRQRGPAGGAGAAGHVAVRARADAERHGAGDRQHDGARGDPRRRPHGLA